VPAGEVDVARAVGEQTKQAGVLIAEYGSYYRLGVSQPEAIDAVVASAQALGTHTVRVWASDKGSEDASEEEYLRAVADARRICIKYKDITFCTECHNHTLTDDFRAHLQLLRDVGQPNFRTFWQPNQYKSFEYNLCSAKALAAYTDAVHVFSWEGDRKLPLEQHRERWLAYLDAFLLESREREMPLMLEFMHDGSIDSLAATAEQLRGLIDAVKA
jgi:hypothetical protein